MSPLLAEVCSLQDTAVAYQSMTLLCCAADGVVAKQLSESAAALSALASPVAVAALSTLAAPAPVAAPVAAVPMVAFVTTHSPAVISEDEGTVPSRLRSKTRITYVFLTTTAAHLQYGKSPR